MGISKAVILAAGEGSRMRPLTYTRPKVMLPIANKPILAYLVEELITAGIEHLVLIVGYHDEQIRDYFGDGSKWGVDIAYSKQRAQLGTADALRSVEDLMDDRFIMVNGDIILNSKDVLSLSRLNGNVMSVIELASVEGMGVIEVDNGHVLRIHEKVENPPTRLANAGLYCFTREIFRAIEKTAKSKRGEYEITDSIQMLIDNNIPISFQLIQEWQDLSYPWNLLNANELKMQTIEKKSRGIIEEGVVIKGTVNTGDTTTIRSGSYIIGPVTIGNNCVIGPNCYIRSCTAIGDNCHIGAAVEIKNSIIMNGTKIPHFNYVGDSIIGENCNLGAGTKIANLRLDKENIIVNGVQTGRRKLGAIIGDNVETGINSMINVGTLIGCNSFIGPGALARGIISPGSKVF